MSSFPNGTMGKAGNARALALPGAILTPGEIFRTAQTTPNYPASAVDLRERADSSDTCSQRAKVIPTVNRPYDILRGFRPGPLHLDARPPNGHILVMFCHRRCELRGGKREISSAAYQALQRIHICLQKMWEPPRLVSRTYLRSIEE